MHYATCNETCHHEEAPAAVSGDEEAIGQQGRSADPIQDTGVLKGVPDVGHFEEVCAVRYIARLAVPLHRLLDMFAVLTNNKHGTRRRLCCQGKHGDDGPTSVDRIPEKL